MNEWIPCNERLPEDGIGVIATVVNRNGTARRVVSIYRMITKPTGGNWSVGECEPYCHGSQVVAWMPLPAPYYPKVTVKKGDRVKWWCGEDEGTGTYNFWSAKVRCHCVMVGGEPLDVDGVELISAKGEV